MKISVERILRDKNDKQIGVTAVVDGTRIPRLSLSELIANRRSYECENFVLTSQGVRAKSGSLPEGWLLTRAEMDEKYDDKWLAVVDGRYMDNNPMNPCLDGIVIGAFSCQQYMDFRLKHFEDSSIVYERVLPKGVIVMGGVYN